MKETKFICVLVHVVYFVEVWRCASGYIGGKEKEPKTTKLQLYVLVC